MSKTAPVFPVRPAATLPALDCDSTGLHFTRLAQRGAVSRRWLVRAGFLLVAQLFVTPWPEGPLTAAAGLTLGLGWTGARWWRYGRWARAVEPLLRCSWREVPATLHGRRVRAGGDVFALRGVPTEVRAVVARTGRVWLAGPGERGFAAVRIAGSGAPWPAVRRVRAGARTPARPIDHVRRYRRAWRWWSIAVAGLVAALAAVIVATVRNPAWTAADVVGAILLHLLVLVPLGKALARQADARWILRWHQRPWTRLHAAVAECDWTGRRRAPVHGWAVLPGGEPAVFRIDDCPLDLYTDIFFRRSLWLRGEPGEGEFVVGMPDFPVLTRASIGRRSSTRTTRE
ncbi:hypothetical protein [Amycolatopsis thermophila]|uniref:Uncharacterized protein n=1 Tax=Amycolatopsis thermophila TaxID=206084 RepID=A0ABU0EYA4_9PSEU|nr:hypothetical protein [Amycolatopsis thermophila]MDQ0379840.1 hypothetical protein [Amycolatopsis thermophila]